MLTLKRSALVLGAGILGASSFANIASAAPELLRTATNDVILFDLPSGSAVQITTPGVPKVGTTTANGCGLAVISISGTNPPATVKAWGFGLTEPTTPLTVATLPVAAMPTCTNGTLSTPVTAAFKTADNKVVVPAVGPAGGTVMVNTVTNRVKNGEANTCGFYVAKSSATSPTLGTTMVSAAYGGATTPQFAAAAVSTLTAKSNLPVCRKQTSPTGTITSTTYVPVGW